MLCDDSSIKQTDPKQVVVRLSCNSPPTAWNADPFAIEPESLRSLLQASQELNHLWRAIMFAQSFCCNLPQSLTHTPFALLPFRIRPYYFVVICFLLLMGEKSGHGKSNCNTTVALIRDLIYDTIIPMVFPLMSFMLVSKWHL